LKPRRLAVLDVDGVIADAAWRLPLLGDDPASASRKAWAAFFDAAGADPLIPSGRVLACQLAVDHEICWLTARSDRTRDLTAAWFDRHDVPRDDLRMRPNYDLRPSPVWKVEQLHELAKTREIDVVIDDDKRVVAMALGQGFPAMFPSAASTSSHHLA